MRDSITMMNPWQAGRPVPLPEPMLKRTLHSPLTRHLAAEDVTIVTGPRQVGKSVLIMSLVEGLLTTGVRPSLLWYLNLDARVLRPLFDSPATLPRLLENWGWNGKERLFLFLDEVQRLDEPGLTIKALHDLHLPLRIVLSGSSQLEMRAQVSEHLTGRSRSFQAFPLQFEEAAAHRFGVPLDRASYWDLRNTFGHNVVSLCAELITFGGYPKVFLAPEPAERRLLLRDLVETYLQKDIRDFLGIDNLSGFMNLLRALAGRSASLLNLNELSALTGMAWETVRSYLDVLEATFVVFRLRPYFGGQSPKELRKMPKLHFLDQGLRNCILQDFSESPFRSDMGQLVESTYAARRFAARHGDGALMFWRTTDGTEVDLVESLPGGGRAAVEVKTTWSGRIPRPLRSFAGAYPEGTSLEVRALNIESPARVETESPSVTADHIFA